ncbi:MAG: hypothetical protein M3Y12_05315, partial [Bacteroidota bacterium]|nr:hypothetical protein [Bacteroidota bacterium]
MATTDTPASDAPDQHFLQPGDSVDFDLSAFSPAADADAQEPTDFPEESAEAGEGAANAEPATDETDDTPRSADLFGPVPVAPVAEPIPAEEVTEEEPKFAPGETIHDVTTVRGMYQNWFLDYASYVILERAVPAIEDGLKPVQRRILHAMKEMDDGRFNKVANVIGQTMQYHPHGDASIGDAMVNLGQKDLLIETQGNWGDVRTG